MEEFILGKEYTFEDIEESLIIYQSLNEYGPEIIGAKFITISERNSVRVCSFILSNFNYTPLYKCIYNDTKIPRILNTFFYQD